MVGLQESQRTAGRCHGGCRRSTPSSLVRAGARTLIVGEVYYAFEGAEATFAHDHGVFGPLFDLAWIVFLPTTFATLVGALVALPLGPITHSTALRRYASRATTYLALAIGVLAVVAVLQS